MKQLILLTAIFLTSTVTLAEDTTTTETCANGAGIVIEGAVADANGNKHKYCKSKNTMNWWNAVSWCDAQGRRLFNLDDCGCSWELNCQNKCPELLLNVDQGIWTSNPKRTNEAYAVNFALGSIRNTNRYNDIYFYALCY